MAGVLLSAAVACVLLAGAVSASSSSPPRVFTVGGVERGWRQPAPGEETYNHWATKNRFHVGDFLHFRYEKNDSVLVVTRDDYKRCGADRPVLRLEGGEARFRLERSGFLYFISGAPGHCDAGQRFTVRVMAERDSGAASPTEAPAMSPGGSFNSTPGSGSGSARMPPRGNAGDGKTSGAAPFGAYHAVGAALGVGAAVLVFA